MYDTYGDCDSEGDTDELNVSQGDTDGDELTETELVELKLA